MFAMPILVQSIRPPTPEYQSIRRGSRGFKTAQNTGDPIESDRSQTTAQYKNTKTARSNKMKNHERVSIVSTIARLQGRKTRLSEHSTTSNHYKV